MVKSERFPTARVERLAGLLLDDPLARGDLLQRQHTVRSGTSISGGGGG